MKRDELLYDHYKETSALCRDKVRERNKLFVAIIVSLAIQLLLTTNADEVTQAIDAIIFGGAKVELLSSIGIIQTITWIILVYLIIRYIQSIIYLEKTYLYIHKIEKKIGRKTIERESENYLTFYPKVQDLISIIYTIVFPSLIILLSFVKICAEYFLQKQVNLFTIIDTLLVLATILLISLHWRFKYQIWKKYKKNES